MTTYGPGGITTSSSRPVKTSPKPLQIRKGAGKKKTMNFSDIKKDKNNYGGAGQNIEEFVSGVHIKHHGIVKAREAALAKTIDEVSLADIVREAPNECDRCHEPLPGNFSTPRYVRVTVRVSYVGAEVDKCILGSICESCFETGTVAKVEDEKSTVATVESTKAADWKRELKPRQLEVWNRCKEQGERCETQATVAASLGLSQGEVSKLLGAAAKVKDRYFANIP
jgi:hypothetical protein